jgi:Ca2+-binding RTX toxin-like protein
MYLTTVGSETDGATLRIGGDSELYLFGTNGSTSYIDRIVITNTAGVSLLGLMDGDRAFSPDGVTVVGGGGDDTLWGGIGFDTISTGGGDNLVYGSLGEDEMTLGENSGLDQIVYGAHNESTFGLGHDTILNFGVFDVIDVFDIAKVTFVGNFSDDASGIAALSTSQARAFFNTTTDTLFIDIDHDKVLGPNHDMQVVLTGLGSFSAGNLFS